MGAAAALVVAAYLMGSLPTSLLVARWSRGIDLRDWGSGNLGATNLYRAAGWPPALIAVLIDVAKGFLPTWFFPGLDGVGGAWTALAYGAAAMVGHIFPIWTRLRGGKGVATGGGAFLALAPAAVGLAGAIWVGIVAMTRIVSMGSLLAATSLPALVWLTGHRGDVVFWASLPIVVLVWWTHRANVRRLLSGSELPARRGVGRPPAEPAPSSIDADAERAGPGS